MNRLFFLISSLFFSGLLFAQTGSAHCAIDSLLQRKRATVGVAVIADGKLVLAVNDEHYYPMMSVFKFHQALAVLTYLQRNNCSLDTELLIDKADLLPDTYSPLREAYPEGNFRLSIRELLRYSVSLSDNNACDLLFKFIGGHQTVAKCMIEWGVANAFITANEQQMHERYENLYLNGSTPSSAAQLMEQFLNGNILSGSHRMFLEQLLIETTTGIDKIKGLLPAEAVVGHKTGSSDRNELGVKGGDNDLAFVRLPDGRHYTIAIFVMNSMEDDRTNAEIIAQISRLVYSSF